MKKILRLESKIIFKKVKIKKTMGLKIMFKTIFLKHLNFIEVF